VVLDEGNGDDQATGRIYCPQQGEEENRAAVSLEDGEASWGFSLLLSRIASDVHLNNKLCPVARD